MEQRFLPGDVVQLVHVQGLTATPGQLGEVVPHTDFPDYYDQMLETIDRKDVLEYFVAIRWFPTQGNLDGPADGFYTRARFIKVRPTAQA